MESSNNTNLTDRLDFSNLIHVFIATGVVHLLLVVTPSLIIGPLILSVFISKKMKDPASILFMCITAVCIVSSLTYGLLMDFSLLTGYPLLGSCEVIRGRLFWFSLYFFQVLLMTGNALLIVLQYAHIRRAQKLSVGKTLTIFTALFLFTLGVSLPNWIAVADTESTVITMRGSLCYTSPSALTFTSFLVVGIISIVVLMIPSSATVTVFAALTVRYVKNHTVNNKKVVRDVLIIMVAMTISVLIFRLAPVLRFLIQPDLSFENDSNSETSITLSWMIDYSLDLSYPIFLVLTLFVHKVVRTTFFTKLKCSNVKKIFGRPSNRITTSSIQPV